MKIALRNIIPILFLAVAMPLTALEETRCIEVHLQNDSIVTYVSDEVRNISHTETTMEVSYENGIDSYQINNVKKVAFNIFKYIKEPFINISQNCFEISCEGQFILFNVSSNIECNIECNEHWLSLNFAQGSISDYYEFYYEFYVEQNESAEPRIASIKLNNNEMGILGLIKVKQKGNGSPYIFISQERFNISHDEQIISFNIDSNIEYSIECKSDWLHMKSYDENGNYEYFVSTNNGESRKATIEIKNESFGIFKVINITQTQIDAAPYINVSQEQFGLNHNEQAIWFYIDSNIEYDIECNADWLYITSDVIGLYDCFISANCTNKDRTATIEIKNEPLSVSKFIKITQNGTHSITPPEIEDLPTKEW